MEIVHRYHFARAWYAIVRLDDGQVIELKQLTEAEPTEERWEELALQYVSSQPQEPSEPASKEDPELKRLQEENQRLQQLVAELQQQVAELAAALDQAKTMEESK